MIYYTILDYTIIHYTVLYYTIGMVLQKLKVETEVRALKFDDTGLFLIAGYPFTILYYYIQYSNMI